MDETALHDLLSGRRRDLSASLLRMGLSAASCAYGLATGLRNFGYDHGLMPVHRASVPVISIGNITTGGTGKTPFAAWIVNWLLAAGQKPGLLSRGYRSLGRDVSNGKSPAGGGPFENDEKLVLDRLCPGVPHIQQKDRVESARRAVREFGCEVLLLDDGYQHRRLHRDLNVVLIDSLAPWGYGHLLPRGLLRESLSGLRRAEVIVLTRVEQSSLENRRQLREQIARTTGRDDCVEVSFVPKRLVDVSWQPQSLDWVAGKRGMAFCGIGNPEGFRKTVASLGIECADFLPFADHHHYDVRDLKTIAARANDRSAEVVLTTQKDLVKIAPEKWNGPPLFAVEIGTEFVGGKQLLETKLQQCVNSSST